MTLHELTKLSEQRSIIIFDGQCYLCNSFIQFVCKNDSKDRFRLVWNQNETLSSLLGAKLDLKTEESVVFLSQGACYTQSDALLRIMNELDIPFCYLSALRIVPKRLRDGIYSWVARHRYGWFGKSDHCLLPNDQSKKKLLTIEFSATAE